MPRGNSVHPRAYSYEEVKSILELSREGKQAKEIKFCLGGTRTAAAIATTLDLFSHYCKNDNKYISPGLRFFFAQYLNEEESKKSDSMGTQKEVEEEVRAETGTQTIPTAKELHQKLVSWYKEGGEVLNAYIKAKIAEETAQLEKEVIELREYKQRVQSVLSA